MTIFNLEEYTYNMEEKKREKVAYWSVSASGLHNDKIIIGRCCGGETHYKVFKVEDTSEFVFKALKTKIKAIGGADGLVTWMIKDQNLFYCRIVSLLNYAWQNMRYEYL